MSYPETAVASATPSPCRRSTRRSADEPENPVYYLLGQTEDGRYLFCLVIEFPGGKGYPVTARQMTAKEERRFKQWKKK